jgi:hypothetical protein
MLADMVTSPLLGHIADCSVGTGYRHQSLEDARWISLVNPGLAEPLAALLDYAASDCENRPFTAPEVLAEDWRFELAIARTILGERDDA